VKTVYSKPVLLYVVLLSLVFFTAGYAQNISDAAQRHIDRGQAAIETAKSDADLEDAINEFEQASRLVPAWPAPYYYLGMVQNKIERFDDALKNLTRYLQLAPNAKDSAQVRTLINKLEYQRDKTEKERMNPKSLTGIWAPDDATESAFYRFEIRNNNGSIEGGLRMFAVTEENGLGRGPWFVPIQWDGRSLLISNTRFFYCDRSVQLNCCPVNASLSLTMAAKDILKGTVRVEPNKKWNPAGLTYEYIWKRVK
jgi:tetratricopeptide (TPR) repeat protein